MSEKLYYPIYESSPQLTEFKESNPRRFDNFPKNKSKLPFGLIEVGNSFVIPMNECNIPSLKVLISNRKTNFKEEYFMFVHYDSNVVEIGRLK